MLRERLRPYIQKQMDTASEKGDPVWRSMLFEYHDDKCYTLDEQYMFEEEIIFALVVNRGQKKKHFIFPMVNGF